MAAAYGALLFVTDLPPSAGQVQAAEAPTTSSDARPPLIAIPFPAQGGPFVALDPLRHETMPLQYPMHFPLDGVRRLVKALPIGAPLEDYRVSSPFGRRRDPVTGRLAIHAGVDLKAPPKARIRARSAGLVVFAGWQKGYGRIVEIDHGMGVTSLYAHLATITVKVGRIVSEGQMIGKVGSSGRSTGPHLHYEIRMRGVPRDPMPLIEMQKDLLLVASPS